jgi:hypothetical protein
MKSIDEIRSMIEDIRPNGASALNFIAILDILFATLEQINMLNSRTDTAFQIPALPAQQIDRRKANRPNELVKRRSTDWPPVPPIHVVEVDYTKPHPFDFDEESGLKHTSYRVCKCGLSEGNVLHQ